MHRPTPDMREANYASAVTKPMRQTHLSTQRRSKLCENAASNSTKENVPSKCRPTLPRRVRRISQLGDGHITRRDHNGLFFCKWLRELSSLTTAHPSLTSSTVVSFSCDGIHLRQDKMLALSEGVPIYSSRRHHPHNTDCESISKGTSPQIKRDQ